VVWERGWSGCGGACANNATNPPIYRRLNVKNRNPLNLLAAEVRAYPHHSIPAPSRENALIFLTVCVRHRARVLANEQVHEKLRELWSDGSHWLVGPYVLMEDHLHSIVAMSYSNTVPIERWIAWWKRLSARSFTDIGLRWQKSFWDTRIRNDEAYVAKCFYMRENPVRKGLVENSADWKFQGIVHRF